MEEREDIPKGEYKDDRPQDTIDDKDDMPLGEWREESP